MYPWSETPSCDPILPCSFKKDAYERAILFLDKYSYEEAIIKCELRRSDDINDDYDRGFWIEVRRACKYLAWRYGSAGVFSCSPMMGEPLRVRNITTSETGSL